MEAAGSVELGPSYAGRVRRLRRTSPTALALIRVLTVAAWDAQSLVFVDRLCSCNGFNDRLRRHLLREDRGNRRRSNVGVPQLLHELDDIPDPSIEDSLDLRDEFLHGVKVAAPDRELGEDTIIRDRSSSGAVLPVPNAMASDTPSAASGCVTLGSIR